MGLWSCRIQVCAGADAVVQGRHELLASSLPSLVGPCREILGSVLFLFAGYRHYYRRGAYGTGLLRGRHREKRGVGTSNPLRQLGTGALLVQDGLRTASLLSTERPSTSWLWDSVRKEYHASTNP